MKKLGTLALTLVLTGSMTVPALAAREMHPLIAPRPENPLIAPNPAGQTAPEIVINGEKLNVDFAAVQGDRMIPLRAVVEADYGSASWFQEEGEGAFYMGEHVINVMFATGAISVDDTAVAEKAVLDATAGVTFVPASVLAGIDGYTVNSSDDRIEITTPNNDPMIQMGYKIANASDMAIGMRETEQGMVDMYDLPAGQFESVFAIFPMMTCPDTIVVGKLAEGADTEAVKTALEAYRARQEETFSWYLSHNLPKVQNAKMIEENGYFLFLMAEDADAGVELFHTLTAPAAE